MTSDCLMVGNLNMIHSENLLSTQQLRLFVGSWNVGGRAPTRETRKSMQEWLMGSSQHPDEPADIYVIGFQETVPLNAGNILGMNFKDGNDAGLLASNKWENLISKTLNKRSSTSWNPGDCIHFDSRAQSTNPAQMETTASTSILSKNASDKNDNTIALFARHSGDNDTELQQYEGGCSVGSANSQCGYTVVEAIADRCGMLCMTPLSTAFAEIEPDLHFGASADKYVYTRITRKCMVGLFISVWVRFDLQHDVQTVQVSSVGCGIMNRLGNKGSVSVSLSVHDTRFCFICTHLSSGNKPGNVLRRNSNVNSILQRTRFYGSEKSQSNASLLPNTILAHDRIIWFGDLNYRLTLAASKLHEFLLRKDWKALIETDELKREKGVGGVFEGWHEGEICFAPTYKYRINSDDYATVDAKDDSKRRTPAWCDRILWHGKGLKQLSYARCESKLSDHRPIKSYFMVEVESLEQTSRLTNHHLMSQSIKPFLPKAKELLYVANPNVNQIMLLKYNSLN